MLCSDRMSQKVHTDDLSEHSLDHPANNGCNSDCSSQSQSHNMCPALLARIGQHRLSASLARVASMIHFG